MSDDILPDIYIGNGKAPLGSIVPVTPDTDPDPDDELIETPQELIDMLGFDPATDPDFNAAAATNDDEGDDGDDAELDKPLPPALLKRLGLDEWSEADHPRGQPGNAGQFGEGGAGPAKGKPRRGQPKPEAPADHPIPEPPKYTHGAALRAIVKLGLERGETPQLIASKLRELASHYQHKAPPRYANTLLRHLEQVHGLEPGALGKAIAKLREKRAGPAPAPAPAPPAPAPPAPTPAPAPPKADPATALPATIGEAAASKLPAEKLLHEESFKEATPPLLAALRNLRDLSAIRRIVSTTSHYDPDLHLIALATSPGSESERSTWRHEYGHAIDWAANETQLSRERGGGPRMNQSYSADGAREDEAKALLAAVAKTSPTAGMGDPVKVRQVLAGAGINEQQLWGSAALMGNRRRIANVLTGNADRETLAEVGRFIGDNAKHSFMDFLGAMTNNAIGYGHSKEYYEKTPKFRTAEMFAEYVDLTNGPNKALARTMLHALAPRCCRIFDDIIDKAGRPRPVPRSSRG